MRLPFQASVPRVLSIALMMMTTAISSAGCKRNTGAAAGGDGGSATSGGSKTSSDGTPGGTTATGAGAVSVTGKVVTYQNVHVEVPWDPSDVAEVVRMSQEAAAGNGLTLKREQWSLVIASDGRSMRLNGRDCGALKEGDSVVLSNDGKLTVNGVVRSAAPPG
jgi:hypothetical protein